MIVSLKESCLRVLTAHSGGLLEVGNCPYRLIRPVLFACPPDQLAYIEDRSPHLMLDSDEIWALHLSRDFPNETVTPPTIRPSSSGSSSKVEDEEALKDVYFPPNRLIYFETRQAKEEALASASARLREKLQASRTDQSKRKTIFTGLTDYGIGSKKKKLNGSKSWGSYTPARKTLAEKARQQVKKSAAVYANAVRAKASLAANPKLTAQAESRKSSPPRSATSAPIFSIRQPQGKTSAKKCEARTSTTQSIIKVVQVSSAARTMTTNNDGIIIKPTPFPKPQPLPQTRLGPLTTPLTRPVMTSKFSQPRCPPPPTAVLLANRNIKSSVKQPSSLFIPKKLKPPPPQPSRSLIPRNP